MLNFVGICYILNLDYISGARPRKREGFMRNMGFKRGPRKGAFFTLIILFVAAVIIFAKIFSSAVKPVSYNYAYDLPQPAYTEPENLVLYEGRVEHIFFHPLIAYPELTFDFDYQAKGFDDWFVTVSEFNKILDSLYEKGFMLVDINEIFEETPSGEIKKRGILMPEGKKPIIISVDDVNYYEYMQQNGTIHRLVLDQNGEVSAYTRHSDGTESITRDNDIVPILDDFVKKHPDFSLRGAKACLALTGYEGILGYRTHSESQIAESEREKVMPVVQRLKASGWSFASHSYAHNDAQKMSYEKLERDCAKWKNEVESLTGPTKIYIYPYGSGVYNTDPKYKLLLSYGFRLMCHVGIESYIKYHSDGVVMDRRHVDGIALRYQGHLNRDLYDADSVIDPIRPAEYQLSN